MITRTFSASSIALMIESGMPISDQQIENLIAELGGRSVRGMTPEGKLLYIIVLLMQRLDGVR